MESQRASATDQPVSMYGSLSPPGKQARHFHALSVCRGAQCHSTTWPADLFPSLPCMFKTASDQHRHVCSALDFTVHWRWSYCTSSYKQVRSGIVPRLDRDARWSNLVNSGSSHWLDQDARRSDLSNSGSIHRYNYQVRPAGPTLQ